MGDQTGSRYIIGIDLGTTNSCVSYVDTFDKKLAIQQFRIPQLTAPGYIESYPTLPSFCYLSALNEWPEGSTNLSWTNSPDYIVGIFARSQGAKVPTRLIQSAKSWLCHPGANRKDKILPFEFADEERRISPVEATAQYLHHIKSAWNHLIAKGESASEFNQQEIVLTVPASFDEISRRLTIEAAKLAGYQQLTLLEEPQAAFYSWISLNHHNWKTLVKEGQTILVCDVGGGTSDFSLIEVHENNGEPVFNRMSVGDHLLLGGDNMDAAIALLIENKISATSSLHDFQSAQWLQLKHQARTAKELFLSDSTKNEFTVHLQGSGSSIIKGSLSIEITRDEIIHLLLNGFFGLYSLEEARDLKKSSSFRTMGLPYEEEPSITKHLAAFLGKAKLNKAPNHVLFNGGSMKPLLFQERLIDSLKTWFPESTPTILESISLDLAVSRGAAYYGKVRRGLGIRIGGGIPKSYYLGIDLKNSDGSSSHQALTLLSRGSDEGFIFEPEQLFSLRPNTPVSFNLYSSQVRLNDKCGDLILIDEKEMQPLPPIHTLLRLGKITTSELIPVRLHIGLTAIGTLELWLQSEKTPHRWALEFQMRQSSGQENSVANLDKARKDELFDSTFLDPAKELILDLYKAPRKIKLMDCLESLLGKEKKEWSSSVLRGLFDTMITTASNRKATPELENRWWNTIGFLLRPGFGYPLDDFRIKELWKVILSEAKTKKSAEVQIQQWICYRRIAGGLNKGQQNQIANEFLAELLPGKIVLKSKNEEYSYSEKIRALASFEYLDMPIKIKLSKALLERVIKGSQLQADFWSLGRLASRHLLYGSVSDVIPVRECAKMAEELLKLSANEKLAHLFAQIARKTDHREINLPKELIERILTKFENAEYGERLKTLMTQSKALSQDEQEEIIGDNLPSGIVLEL